MPEERNDRIGGRYPGGPRRESAGELGREPRLESVEEFEARRARAHSRAVRGRRSRRVQVGFVLALLASGGLGLAIGWLSHRDSEEIARAREEARMQSTDVSQEVNRVLLELWRMEDIEYQRNRGR